MSEPPNSLLHRSGASSKAQNESTGFSSRKSLQLSPADLQKLASARVQTAQPSVPIRTPPPGKKADRRSLVLPGSASSPILPQLAGSGQGSRDPSPCQEALPVVQGTSLTGFRQGTLSTANSSSALPRRSRLSRQQSSAGTGGMLTSSDAFQRKPAEAEGPAAALAILSLATGPGPEAQMEGVRSGRRSQTATMAERLPGIAPASSSTGFAREPLRRSQSSGMLHRSRSGRLGGASVTNLPPVSTVPGLGSASASASNGFGFSPNDLDGVLYVSGAGGASPEASSTKWFSRGDERGQWPPNFGVNSQASSRASSPSTRTRPASSAAGTVTTQISPAPSTKQRPKLARAATLSGPADLSDVAKVVDPCLRVIRLADWTSELPMRERMNSTWSAPQERERQPSVPWMFGAQGSDPSAAADKMDNVGYSTMPVRSRAGLTANYLRKLAAMARAQGELPPQAQEEDAADLHVFRLTLHDRAARRRYVDLGLWRSWARPQEPEPRMGQKGTATSDEDAANAKKRIMVDPLEGLAGLGGGSRKTAGLDVKESAEERAKREAAERAERERLKNLNAGGNGGQGGESKEDEDEEERKRRERAAREAAEEEAEARKKKKKKDDEAETEEDEAKRRSQQRLQTPSDRPPTRGTTAGGRSDAGRSPSHRGTDSVHSPGGHQDVEADPILPGQLFVVKTERSQVADAFPNGILLPVPADSLASTMMLGSTVNPSDLAAEMEEAAAKLEGEEGDSDDTLSDSSNPHGEDLGGASAQVSPKSGAGLSPFGTLKGGLAEEWTMAIQAAWANVGLEIKQAGMSSAARRRASLTPAQLMEMELDRQLQELLDAPSDDEEAMAIGSLPALQEDEEDEDDDDDELDDCGVPSLAKNKSFSREERAILRGIEGMLPSRIGIGGLQELRREQRRTEYRDQLQSLDTTSSLSQRERKRWQRRAYHCKKKLDHLGFLHSSCTGITDSESVQRAKMALAT